ncbi:MAG: potassium transporter TrkA [Alphaproteobacteria bacterium]|nr:potassium transporter TrkA [Alphaproteobacteria bacterium]
MTEAINIAAYSDALVILGTAGIVVPLVGRSGISPVIGYLGAGAVLGPLGLGSFIGEFPFLSWFTINNTGNVSRFADLGVVFLFFLIGLELSFARLMSMRRLVFGLGGLQIANTMTILSILAWLAGQRPTVAIILGASLALSSTAIVLDMLSTQGRVLTGAGRASFSVPLAQDLAVIPLLMFISILGSHTEESLIVSLGQALAQAVLAVSVIVMAGRVLLRPIFRLVGSLRSEELFIAAVLFVIIGIGVIASVAGLSMTLGAFIAGLLLAETEYRRAIHAAIKPFQGILLGIFFFTVGMNIDPHALAREPLLILAAVTALITTKASVLIILSKFFKMTWSAAIETGLLLGAGGEFAFVVLALATALGLIGADITRFTLVVTSLTVLLIPLLSVLAQRLDKFLEKSKTPDPELTILPVILQKHAIVIGYGRVGKVVSTLLERHGVPYTATDYDARMVAKDRRNGFEVFYGDAANRAFLEACGLMQATGVIITINSYPIIDDIIRQVREMRPDIIIVSRARDAAHAKHMYEMGVTDAVPETIEASLHLSEAALVAFGVPAGFAIASVHEQRDEFRKELQLAARLSGAETSHGMRAKSV